jgi:TolB-like protein/tetratricopeptide (TPR) repeat protein
VNPARPILPVRWRAFGAALAILLIITLWLRVTAGPRMPPGIEPTPAPRSIAVLPFINASPDSAYDYLGEGIGADLTTALGRVPGLRVAGGRSAIALAGEDPVTIGRRLRVASVLVGSIRPVGDRLRVSAHLVSVEGGFDLWSDAFERPPAGFMGVEREIVLAVAANLRLRGALPSLSLFRTAPATHDAYLKARHSLARSAAGEGRLAAADFRRVIGLDSNYAPAWVGMAQANLRDFLTETALPDEVIPLARQATERAVFLDSTLAMARIARSVIWLLYDRDPAKAAAEIARAIALDPSLPDGYDWQAHRLLAVGQTDSAIATARRAVESSPFDAALRAHLGWQYLLARQDSLAAVTFGRARALDSVLATTDEHMAWLARLPADSGSAFDSLVAAGKEHYVSAHALAVAAVAGGRTSEAIAALSRAMAERTPWVTYARLDPRLEALRGNRRFEMLLTRLPQTTIPTRMRPQVDSR